jgi:hypothetical protein
VAVEQAIAACGGDIMFSTIRALILATREGDLSPGRFYLFDFVPNETRKINDVSRQCF